MTDLAEWSDLESILGVVEASSPAALSALGRASADFRSAVRHEVSEAAYDVTLDGTGTSTLSLPAAPVTAVSGVEVDGDPVSDYRWSASGLLERAAGWPRRYRAVRVQFVAGFDPIPDDIRSVVVDRALGLLRSRPGLKSHTLQVGGMSETESFAEIGTSERWETTVARYRLNRGDRP